MRAVVVVARVEMPAVVVAGVPVMVAGVVAMVLTGMVVALTLGSSYMRFSIAVRCKNESSDRL